MYESDIKMTPDFPMTTLEARRQLSNAFESLSERGFQPRILVLGSVLSHVQLL